MATTVQEMEDLGRVSGSLLVNIGTLVPTAFEGMMAAGEIVCLSFNPLP